MEGWVLGTSHDFTVRRLESPDLPFVVNQHLQNVPEGFFARLGTRFLTGYYLSYCTDSSACSVVAVDGDEAVGFLVGTPDPSVTVNTHCAPTGDPCSVRPSVALIRQPRLAALFLRTRAVRYARNLLSNTDAPRPRLQPTLRDEQPCSARW